MSLHCERFFVSPFMESLDGKSHLCIHYHWRFYEYANQFPPILTACSAIKSKSGCLTGYFMLHNNQKYKLQ